VYPTTICTRGGSDFKPPKKLRPPHIVGRRLAVEGIPWLQAAADASPHEGAVAAPLPPTAALGDAPCPPPSPPPHHHSFRDAPALAWGLGWKGGAGARCRVSSAPRPWTRSTEPGRQRPAQPRSPYMPKPGAETPPLRAATQLREGGGETW